MDAARCLIAVPYRRGITPACDEALRRLEGRGYPVLRDGEPDAIDHKRSRIATRALDGPFDEILWIDSDIQFQVDDVERLRSHQLPLVGGFYAGRGRPDLSCRPLPESKVLPFGDQGTVLEVWTLATGFLLTHRRVFEDVARVLDLPACREPGGESDPVVVPYFLPIVQADPQYGMAYLSEDYSFCERARRAGHKVMLDSSLRLWHLGRHGYGWEDVGAPVRRVPGGQMTVGRR